MKPELEILGQTVRQNQLESSRNTKHDEFYFKNADGNTTSKTATKPDNAVEVGHEQADGTGALALQLQPAVDAAAATEFAANSGQRISAASKQHKPRVFSRSKIASSSTRTTAAAQCADTAVSKQSTNDTPTLTGDRPTQACTTVNKQIVGLHDKSSTQGWFTIKTILTHQKRGSRMFYKVEWEAVYSSWIPQKDVSDFARDVYWLQKREKARLRKSKRQ